MRLLLTLLATLLITVTSAETLVLQDPNVVTIRGPITEKSSAATILDLITKDSKLPANTPIFLILDTPGGSIDAGNMIIAAAKGLGRKVHTVTIFAASMGYMIAQALDNRYMIESATLMSHRAAVGGISGQVPGEANSRIQWITDSVELMEISVAKRVGIPVEEYKASIVNELWLNSKKAVATNHADNIVNLKCGKTLLVTEEREFDSFFGTATVTFSKCPLITAPIKVKMSGFLSNKIELEKAIRYVYNSFNSLKAVELLKRN